MRGIRGRKRADRSEDEFDQMIRSVMNPPGTHRRGRHKKRKRGDSAQQSPTENRPKPEG